MSVRRLARNPLMVAAFGVMLLEGCAVAPPTGPDVAVMPGQNKTLAQFQQDDATCRQYASQQTGGASPAQAANQSAIGSAAVGTALGAAAGALIGAASGHAGAGAAVGAGAGLLTGTAVGAGNASESAASLQQRYDISYTQCMAAQGNPPPQGAPQVAAAPVPYPGYVVAPAPYYYPPPAYYGPEVVVGYGPRWHRW